jgi:hypothetical protein
MQIQVQEVPLNKQMTESMEQEYDEMGKITSWGTIYYFTLMEKRFLIFSA